MRPIMVEFIVSVIYGDLCAFFAARYISQKGRFTPQNVTILEN
jgi:hypothetical protein